jgi:hypothetical protein
MMMKQTLMNITGLRTLLLAGLLTGTFFACKKDPKPAVEENKPLEVFEKGVPVGTPVTKSIGPEGGVIAMPDGRIAVTVPAGAVAAATMFGIQPVTSTLPLSCDSITYKLTPENVKFAKPVTIRFNYSAKDIDGTAVELLNIAYQDTAGHWLGKTATVLDSIHHTLTVNSHHFSTWGAYQLFKLMAEREVVSEGERCEFYIYGIVSSEPITEAQFDDVTVPLVSSTKYNSAKNVSGWKVHGLGTLAVQGDKSWAFYTAPSSVKKKSTATVEVTLSNLFDKKDPLQPGRSGKMILLKSLELLPVKFEFYVDGNKVELTDIRASSNGSNMVIIAKNGVNELQVTINATGSGSFPWAFPSGGIPVNQAVIYYGPDTDDRYLCGTTNCENGVPNGTTKTSPGGVGINSWGNVGDIVSGQFTAALYRYNSKQNPCDIKSISVKGEFSMRRK